MVASLNLLLAANGTETSGAGHAMRLLSYGRALNSLGYLVDFFGTVTLPWLRERLKFESEIGNGNSEKKYELIIVDSYEELFIRYISQKFNYRYLIQIADSHSPIGDVTGLIWLDPFPIQKRKKHEHLILAQGMKYTPTRLNNSLEYLPKVAQEVMVVVGGSPTQVLTQIILQSLSDALFFNIQFHFFLGQPRCDSVNSNFLFHDLGKSLDSVIETCDTVITAAGTSLWDFLAIRRCVGALSIVANQTNNYIFAKESRLIAPLGNIANGEGLSSALLSQLFFDESFRHQIANNCQEHFNEDGAKALAIVIDNFIKRHHG